MALLIFTGIRRGEALGLQWEDIDFDRKLINIQRSLRFVGNKGYIGPTKSKAGVRLIPLEPQLEDILTELPYFDLSACPCPVDRFQSTRCCSEIIVRYDDKKDISLFSEWMPLGDMRVALLLYSFVVHFTPPVFQCISQACSHGLEKDENLPDNRKSLTYKAFPVCP